jgi:hypothetical protein
MYVKGVERVAEMQKKSLEIAAQQNAVLCLVPHQKRLRRWQLFLNVPAESVSLATVVSTHNSRQSPELRGVLRNSTMNAKDRQLALALKNKVEWTPGLRQLVNP